MRQIAEIKAQLERLHAERDRIDEEIREAEREAQIAIAELQAVLGTGAAAQSHIEAPVVARQRRTEPERDLTDYDVMGADTREDGITAEDFRAELATLRAHNIEKRRRLS